MQFGTCAFQIGNLENSKDAPETSMGEAGRGAYNPKKQPKTTRDPKWRAKFVSAKASDSWHPGDWFQLCLLAFVGKPSREIGRCTGIFEISSATGWSSTAPCASSKGRNCWGIEATSKTCWPVWCPPRKLRWAKWAQKEWIFPAVFRIQPRYDLQTGTVSLDCSCNLEGISWTKLLDEGQQVILGDLHGVGSIEFGEWTMGGATNMAPNNCVNTLDHTPGCSVSWCVRRFEPKGHKRQSQYGKSTSAFARSKAHVFNHPSIQRCIGEAIPMNDDKKGIKNNRKQVITRTWFILRTAHAHISLYIIIYILFR